MASVPQKTRPVQLTLRPDTIEVLQGAATRLGLTTQQGGVAAGGRRGSLSALMRLIGAQIVSGQLVLKNPTIE